MTEWQEWACCTMALRVLVLGSVSGKAEAVEGARWICECQRLCVSNFRGSPEDPKTSRDLTRPHETSRDLPRPRETSRDLTRPPETSRDVTRPHETSRDLPRPRETSPGPRASFRALRKT